MTNEQLNLIINLGVIALASLSLALLITRGELRERVLRQSPPRDPGLGQPAYAIAAGLVGFYVAAMLLLNPSNSQAEQLTLTFIPFVLVGMMIGPLISVPDGLRTVGIIPTRPGRDLIWAGLATIVGLCLSMSSSIGLDAMLDWLVRMNWLETPPPEVVHETLRKLKEEFSPQLLISVIIGAVILAPLFEEMIFRGILQTSLLNLLGQRRWPTLIISSLLFSLTHWWVVPWQGLLPLFIIGLVFGYVYERTGSLLTSVVTHALFNASNIAILMIGIAAGEPGG